VEQTLHSLLDDCLSRHKADAIVLGCTHYPFLKDSIRKVAGDKILLMDGSEGTARELKRRLQAENLLREDGHKGQVIFEMSLPEKLPLCRKLLEE
jgi:glutamate racemase